MFKKIKKNWQKKIERNAFKSELKYINREGIKLLNKGTPMSELPDSVRVTENVIFKRSLLPLGDWGRIYPPIKENGKLSLTNLIFGGWRNLIYLIAILIIVGLVFIQFKENFETIEALKSVNNLCKIAI